MGSYADSELTLIALGKPAGATAAYPYWDIMFQTEGSKVGTGSFSTAGSSLEVTATRYLSATSFCFYETTAATLTVSSWTAGNYGGNPMATLSGTGILSLVLEPSASSAGCAGLPTPSSISFAGADVAKASK